MLESYKKKRHFDKTPEPGPEVDPFEDAGPLTFVIQKHAARRLHYDLRLELDGVLKSWAVPKGPSLNPADKQLAVMVEDHPLSYAGFEGQIPKGEYGGGEVIVWDRGIYSPDEDGLHFDNRAESELQMRKGLEKGKLSFTLRGTKLNGSWTLVKIAKSEKDWLLIKHHDEHVSEEDVTQQDRSVVSGRTVEDVREGRESPGAEKIGKAVKGASKAAMPKGLVPMAVSERQKPFTNKDWSFELKLDGIRVLAYIQDGEVTLVSRNGKDVTRKFPLLTDQLRNLGGVPMILDGEVVLYDENGRPTFQGLLKRFLVENEVEIRQWEARAPIEFLVFDLIYLDGFDLRKATYSERRKALEALNPHSSSMRVIDTFPEEGELLFEQATNLGFEGIVAKKIDSRYQDGKRSTDWVKIKGYHTEEFLVGGFTKGEGGRGKTFGALLLGRYEDGKFIYLGNVGGGFSDEQCVEIRKMLDAIKRPKSPFDSPPPVKGATWVEPTTWVEVKFMSWTDDRKLRFPVFQRLRPDVEILEELPEAQSKQEEMQATSEIEAVLNQLKTEKSEMVLAVEGQEIKLTSLDKVLWPAHGDQAPVTKRDYVGYLATVSESMIRHLRDRPISFVRLPEGLGGESFFQKHWDKGRPDFIETVDIYSTSKDEARDYVLVNNLPTLIWLGQMSSLEIHPWYSRVSKEPDGKKLGTDFGSSDEALDASALNYPDFMVCDLDPYIRSGKEAKGAEPELNRAGWDKCVEIALALRDLLKSLNLKSYVKTSGKTGIHVYVPLIRRFTYPEVRVLCETIGVHLMRQHPDDITMEWKVAKRPAKVFFDHNQNVRGKTLSAPYSTRAHYGATVCMPIAWEHLPKFFPTDFSVFTVPGYLSEWGDPWSDIMEHKQELPLGNS